MSPRLDPQDSPRRSAPPASLRTAPENTPRQPRWQGRHAPPEPHGERHTRRAPAHHARPHVSAHQSAHHMHRAQHEAAPDDLQANHLGNLGDETPDTPFDAPSDAMSNVAPGGHTPWDADEWEEIAHECATHRGYKLSTRQLRLMTRRARRRHLATLRRLQKPPCPRVAKPGMPLWKHLRRITAVLAVFALGELTLAALTAPQFAVQSVTCDEAPLTPPEALSAVELQLAGQNWLRARTAPSVEHLKTLPMVRDAQVRRELDWPPRLHVTVTEREPFARVGSGDEWWVVDQHGVPFRRTTARDVNLYAVSSRVFKPEAGKPLPKEHWQSVVAFAAALAGDARQGHDWALRAIYFDQHGFASLRLADTAPGAAPGDRLLVHLGTGPWEKKLQRARQTLQWFQATGRRAEVLNLVSYKRPVWTPRRQAHTLEKPDDPHPA